MSPISSDDVGRISSERSPSAIFLIALATAETPLEIPLESV